MIANTKIYQQPDTIKPELTRSNIPIQNNGTRISVNIHSENKAEADTLINNDISKKDSLPMFGMPMIGDTVSGSFKRDSLSLQTVTYISLDSQQRHEGKPLPFSLEKVDCVFGLMLICLLFFAHIGGFSFLKQNLQVIFSVRKSNKLQKDSNIKETLSTYFLVIQTIILSSICLYNELVEYFPDRPGARSTMITILGFVLITGIFFVFKFLVYRILGYIFDLKEIADSWIRTYIVVLEVYGLLFFIPTLLLIYSSYWHLQIACFMLILLIIGQIILFYRIAVYFIRQKFNFLFLIVYLCSLEIIPYLLLVGTLVFLYSTDVLQIIWH